MLPERGTVSMTPMQEVTVDFPPPKLAELTDDDIVAEISSIQERGSSPEL
jgi:hypothetical protein